MDLSNENVIHISKNGIEYLQFKRLLEYQNKINHAYSLGIDKNYRTAKPNNDDISIYKYNKGLNDYKNLCDSIGTNYINIVKTNQEHTDEVKIVEDKLNINEPDFNLKQYNRTDGLITNKKNIILSATNADCILFLFYDPIKNVIANVHSGWKGTLQRIAVKTVQKMCKEFGSDPKDIIICVCPSIRKCHFEVEQDVKDMYIKEFTDIKPIDEWMEETIKNKKWHIDTVLINKKILVNEGVEEKNIIDSGICSVCNSDIIHSYRVEKQGYGVETAIIELK